MWVAVTPAHTCGRWQGRGARLCGCTSQRSRGSTGERVRGCSVPGHTWALRLVRCPLPALPVPWVHLLFGGAVPARTDARSRPFGAAVARVPVVRGPGPGGSGPRCPGRALPGSAGTPRARAFPPPLPFPLKGPQRPAGRTLGSRSPPPAPSPSSGGGSARGAPVLPSPAGVGSLRGAGRGGGASPDTGRRWERGGERSAGGDKRRRAAGRRWMEAPACRDARSSLECPGEPPPSGTGTRTGTREGARRRGNARASRRRRALRGRGREGRARLLREGRARPGAAAGGGSCHPAGLVRTAGLCAPCPRCAGLSRCTALRGAGRALPSCLALIYGLISQGTRLHSARFVI